MQPPRPFRGYDKDMFTFLPTSNRDALGESPRKRKLGAYDRQIPMPAPSRSGRSGPKSYTGDFRDKELRNAIPASPHRESSHLRDYPRKSRSWDWRNYEESCHSNKGDRHESIPEYSSPRRESPHFRDYPRKNQSCDQKNYEESGRSNRRDRHESIPEYSSPRRGASHFRDYPRKNQSFDQKNYEESCRSNKRDRHESISEYAGYSSPHRESSYLRDYPRKNRSCDQNYEESCHSNNSDRNETRSGYTGYSSFRGQLQSPYHKNSSPSSMGQTHKSSKWPGSMTEDLIKFERYEVNEPKGKYKNASHVQEFWNSGPQKPDQMEVLATSSHDQSPKTVEKSQNLHQVLKTGASVVDIHERDFQTYKASKWSPMMTEANHLLSHKSNAYAARKENGSDFQEFRNSGPQKPEQMNFMSSSSYDLAFKNPREPQCLQQSFLIPQASSVGFDEKSCQAQNASKWPSSTVEHFGRHESYESNREQLVSHCAEFQNCGPQKLAQINAVAPSSHEQISEETAGSQSFKQNFLNPGAFVMDSDAKCFNEETSKAESSSTAKESGLVSSYTGLDDTKMSGENVGTSECDLQSETNKLLQNALRLLSAASGIVSDNSSGKVPGQDEVKLMKLLLDSGIQNLKHSIVEATTSKSTEGTPNSDKPGLNGEKGSVKLGDQCEYENKASPFTEKLWEGTLQLSTAVSVSAVAFFKSGEKMQDFSWSDSVAVKGKVRLEAFEKYVQDLPRSRTRGLMVISFCCKEGSSDDWLKGMKGIARKYKDGKKVGFAQLSSGVDLYICPHSDAVITILAKHGFFKGMAAVKDKNDPLIGCVAWRKTPSSKTTDANTSHSSDPSLRSSVEQIPDQNSTMANENQEPISFSSVIGASKEEEEDMPPGFEIDLETDKSNLQPPTVVPENSGASSSSDNDDDDLPEYNFGAVVSQTLGNQISDVGANDSGFAAEKLRENDPPRPISTQMRSESSIISSKLPDFQFQGLVSQSLGHQSESHSQSLPIESQKHIRESTSSLKPQANHIQRPDPQKRGHMHDLQNSSLTVQKQKQTENSAAISNSSTLFDDDDDDIPEWRPPVFTNSGPEVVRGERPSFSSSHPEVPTSGFAIPASSGDLPPLPPLPPPPRPQLELRNNDYSQIRGAGPSFVSSHSRVPNSGFADLASCRPLPPLPPTPPPAHLQFRKEDYRSTPHLPTPLASKPFADGFRPQSPAFPPNFARNSASGPQFDLNNMQKPVYRPAWRGPRP